MLILLLLLGLVPLWQASPVWAATIAVTTTADELSTNGQCSLREAIRNANADAAVHPDCPAGSGPDRITLPAGTYTLTILGRLEDAAATGDLDLTGNVEIEGGSAATTIAEAGPEGVGRVDRIFDVQAGASVTLSGLTVRRGKPTQLGASFADVSGGGIRSSGALTVTDSVIADNAAFSVGTGDVPNAFGGGIFAPGGSLTVRRTTFRANTAEVDGGAVSFTAAGGVATFDDVTMEANFAHSDGGGLDVDRGTITVTNSTVSGNMALRAGGGVNNNGAELSIISSTIAGNTATRGSGIDNNTSHAIAVRSSILENTGAGNCWYFQLSAATSLGSNLSSDATCKFDAASDLNSTNPLLGPLADNGGLTRTHALLPGSPAIDAVQGGCPPPATDQRGIARPLDGNGDGGAQCDIGAVEAPAVSPPTATPTATGTPIATGTPTATGTPGSTSTPTPTPTPTPESARSSSDDDKTVRSDRKPSEDIQRQEDHTNKGNRDDSLTEGDVIEVHADATPPYLVLANRDGPVTVQLVGPAAEMAGSLRVGDYVEVEGVKQHEGLFEAENVNVSR